ncbi:VanZ family protein [Aerococcus christensenii]|uniref:VanZ family protein n=1 Tax=Aerococcus christensenii TaxID=87541 RepID=UPI003F41DCF4
MIVLGVVLSKLEVLFEGKINHLPLIRLFLFSLDKTLLYVFGMLVVMMVVYSWWKKKSPQRTFPLKKWKRNIIFLTYVILILHLTALRYKWKWWAIHPVHPIPWNQVHYLPFSDTIKLYGADSPFSYWYNFFGNVLWFIPLGYWLPYFMRTRYSFFRVVGIGMSLSLGIECFQLIFQTGVAHIDDVIFNTMGVILGHLSYDIYQYFKKGRRQKHEEIWCKKEKPGTN